MANTNFILNTLTNSITFINNTGLLQEITLHLDRDTPTCKLERIYKITYSKVICFDVFRIQEMLDKESEHIFHYKYLKYKTIISKMLINIVLHEYLLDKSKYDDNEFEKACDIYSTKYLFRNIGKARRFIGKMDTTDQSDIILNNTCKLYVKDNVKTDLIQ